MLKRFEVLNYRGFKNKMVWDLSQTRDYTFYKPLTKNHISNHSIVYGANSSGKSCLCSAIVDITNHLLEVQKDEIPPHLYTYIGNDSAIAVFKYVFVFDKKVVVYKYGKTYINQLVFEQMFINDKEVIHYNFVDGEKNFVNIASAKKLRIQNVPNHLSIIKYIYNNTIQDDESVISKLIKFVSGMLSFRSLREANQYIGYKLGGESLDNIILRNNRLEDYKRFLEKMGMHFQLVQMVSPGGQVLIGVKFENGKVVPFHEISSSGTKVLMLFYCWLLEFDKLTFLIIDEFDAHYHHEVARAILEIIEQYDNMQSMVTTHNVTLLRTDVTRPDCAYIIDDIGVINLSSRTTKELRKNHNIEKMYRSGEFSSSN